MRWLVGWSSATAGPLPGARSRALQPVGAQLLWGDPDPLWAVGDWRPDEVRVVHADANARARANGSAGYGAGAAYGGGYGDANGHGGADSYGGAGAYGAASYGSSQGVARLAVLGRCGATDAQLRLGLVAARGGALRHVTAWPGSYTAVLQLGRRITVLGDLAGALPVFHTRWRHGTAYATAALPLADLIEAGLDVTHLAATLACPDAPEALLDGTPYLGVRRVPPGHALILRDGAPEITGYEPTASLAVGHQPASTADGLAAVEGVRDALLDAVRVRLAQPRFVPDGALDGAGPAPGIGADLSGGIASSTLALLAAGLPGMPGTLPGAPGSLAGERLLAVTFNDLVGGLGGADGAHGSAAELSELERAREMAADPRLRHIVVPGGPEALPYADLVSGWSEGSGVLGALTDEPGPALVSAERHRRRLAAGGADHLIGYGARQVLDAHPARLADLLMDRRRRHLLRPVAALTRADGGGTLTGSLTSVTVPLTVYRAARRLARTPYRQGVEDVASALLRRDFGLGGPDGPGGGALTASLAAMVWVRSGPAARWLTGEALAEVSVRLQDAAHRPWPLERPGERRARAALARHAADYRVLEQAATVPSQRLHAPFLDNQVVRACQALPSALRVRPGARAEVLRVALSGAGVHGLPPGWGSGSPAAAGSSAARIGLRSALDPLLDLFEAPLLADAGLVDARVLRGAFRAAASAAAGSGGASGGAAGSGEVLALEGLGEIVATELWLRRLLGRRGSCWTGTDAPEQRALAGGVQRLTL